MRRLVLLLDEEKRRKKRERSLNNFIDFAFEMIGKEMRKVR